MYCGYKMQCVGGGYIAYLIRVGYMWICEIDEEQC